MAYVSTYVDLGDINEDELRNELESRGYTCIIEGLTREQFTEVDYARITHLVEAGQKEAAQAEALEMIGEAIGKSLL